MNADSLESDTLELGPLVKCCRAISIREILRNIGTENWYFALYAGIPFLFVLGCMAGAVLALLVGAPMPFQQSALGLILTISGGTSLSAFYIWWAFFLGRKSYLAVYQRGLAYKCFLNNGRIRYSDIKVIDFGPMESTLENAVLEIMKETHPQAYASVQRGRAGTLRLELADGRVLQVPHILNHFHRAELVQAFRWIAENQPSLLAPKTCSNADNVG